MRKGIVYLIGAGPGDPGLISRKAAEILEEADCIIYDYLASEELVTNQKSEKIYVGKKGGDHTLPQDEINRLIIEKAKSGKTVARLKGGDPFIFGRGAEEAEELLKAGIRFEIIPGISSFYSAPAYAGIPVTHRDYANAFEVITGHRKNDAGNEEDINFPEFNPQKTFIFLMGMRNIEYITSKLISEKNFPTDTPAAVISWGTTPVQKTAYGTLNNIAAAAEKEKTGAPAIIVIGKVAGLREKLKWFDNLPLFGKKIAVTRTRAQASRLSRKLFELGAEVLEFPVIEIKPVEPPVLLDRAISELKKYHWIVFTSQNAVEIFFNALKRNGLDARAMGNLMIAAIGPATSAELNRRFIVPDIIPDEHIAEAIISEMSRFAVKGKHILLPCATEARLTLKEGLESLGAAVDRIHIYDTVTPDIDEEFAENVQSCDMITFTSSSTVKNFFGIINNSKAKTACIGPVTAETLRNTGREPDVIAKEYTIEGLVAAIAAFYGGTV